MTALDKPIMMSLDKPMLITGLTGQGNADLCWQAHTDHIKHNGLIGQAYDDLIYA